MLFSCFRATSFGSFAVIWSNCKGGPKIVRILLSDPGNSAKQKAIRYFPGTKASSHQKINAIINKIERFFNGADIHFLLAAVRLDLCPAFQQRVLRAQHAIPRGRMSTYGLIAKRIGQPRAARAVGAALATNPFPIIIPCHRTIRYNGMLGGYQGGTKMKRVLLKLEGIQFRNVNRVLTAYQSLVYKCDTCP